MNTKKSTLLNEMSDSYYSVEQNDCIENKILSRFISHSSDGVDKL
jgi:hypothetical protein